jgi:flagellar basal body-associated protein FliL
LEIDNGNTSIYLNHLDEVKLIHEINKNEEESKKKDYLKIILIIGAVILVFAVIAVIILFKTNIRNKFSNMKTSTTKNEVDEKVNKNQMIESSNSTKRSENNKFKNP